MFDGLEDLDKVAKVREVLSTLKEDARNESDHCWALNDREGYDLWQVSADTFLLAMSLLDQAFPDIRQDEMAEELVGASE